MSDRDCEKGDGRMKEVRLFKLRDGTIINIGAISHITRPDWLGLRYVYTFEGHRILIAQKDVDLVMGLMASLPPTD